MKKNILLLFFLLLSSCESQKGTALSSAFTNIITGKGFSDTSGDVIYNQIKEEQNKSSQSSLNEVICKTTNVNQSLYPKLKLKLKNMSDIKDQLCSCQAWGTCDNLSCSCDSLCPNNFEILNRTGNALNDDTENSLSITNNDIEFYHEYTDYSGFCWGHAIVTQRFNRLAKFEPNLPLPFASEEYDSDRINEYRKIIEKINNNEPVDIPGFKNLYEFSSDPEVKALLRESVKDNWAANAMSAQGLSIVASGTPQGGDYYTNLFNDLEFRLKHNQTPLIIFNDKNQSTYAHAVLVSGQGTDSDGNRFLCIRDNNYMPDSNTFCKSKMILSVNGIITYDRWSRREIGQVKLSYNENSNTVEQVKNLRTKCLGDKNCEVE